jgi:hypothetical protein
VILYSIPEVDIKFSEELLPPALGIEVTVSSEIMAATYKTAQCHSQIINR